MALFRLFGLFSECFSIAGTAGLIACANLRHYVNWFVRKTRRFLWDWVPDLLLIIGSTFILMCIWELCFWN